MQEESKNETENKFFGIKNEIIPSKDQQLQRSFLLALDFYILV